MKLPDITIDEVRSIADGAYKMAEDTTTDADYVIAQTAYRIGIDTARDDFLEALELLKAYSCVREVNLVVTELRAYLLSNLSVREWYNLE